MTWPEDDEIFEPSADDRDSDAEREMQQGRADVHPDNDLRDPWFGTDEGRAWLAEHGEG